MCLECLFTLSEEEDLSGEVMVNLPVQLGLWFSFEGGSRVRASFEGDSRVRASFEGDSRVRASFEGGS